MLDIWASRTFTVQPGENRCEADESPPNSPVTAFTAPRIEQRLGGLLFVGAARKTWPTTPPRHRIGEDEPARPGRSRLRKPLMMFVVIAVVLVAAFGLLDGLVRARIKRRRTGDSGVRVPSTPAQSRARGTLALGKLLPGIAVLARHRRPPERPALVTRGIYAIARNPVYTAIIVMALGLTLLVPNGIALTGLAMIITGRQPQVRLIEEPYLHHIHGPAYHDYAARVGRFLPGIGRLRVQPQDHR